MPIDTSIYANQKPVQMETPGQAMNMAQLARQGQIQQQNFQDDQAVRQAFKNNVISDASGNQQVNRQGVLSDLYKMSPQRAMELQSQFTSQDLQKQKQQTELAKEFAWGANPDNWSEIKAKAVQMGMNNADKLPDKYDEKFIKNWKMHTLSGEEQLNAQMKQQEFDLKKQEIGIKREEMKGNKQNTALKDTVALLESARGNPAVGQAEKDIYAAQKANTLYDQTKGNPNPEMAKLYISEIAKIAQGGVPTVDELKGLTPGVLTGPMAKAWENLSGNPTPAGMQNFMAQYKDYANGIAKDAQQVIKDKYGRIIDSRSRLHRPDDNQKLNDEYINRFKVAEPESKYHAMTEDDLDKAYKAAGGK